MPKPKKHKRKGPRSQRAGHISGRKRFKDPAYKDTELAKPLAERRADERFKDYYR